MSTIKVDFWNLTAIRCHGKPDGWKWCKIDCHNKPEGFNEVYGAVPIGEIKSGPRKGKPRWPHKKLLELVWIKDDEIEETKLIWEAETGKCAKCEGTGQEWWSWSKFDGSKYRTCSRCKGSGKPQKKDLQSA